ncbi:thiamine pyrophosphate-binding protein [Rhizobium beringeri]
MTGKPGICFVTRGPGATNASVGVHTAFQGSDTDDPVHRAGGARSDGARSVPGNRLSPHVRPDGEVGHRDRGCRPHS